MNSDILLESGTGEVEILEFVIGNRHYGINIIKVKEVIDCSNLTRLPNSHPFIAGLILCREEIITLVDLAKVLEGREEQRSIFKTIICEFNKLKIAFNIDDVLGVSRISWEEIVKPNELSMDSLIIGNVIKKDKIILLLDFEKIVTDINPSVGINEKRIYDIDYKDRGDIKVAIVDDSLLIRELLKETLNKAGFKNLLTFKNGREALDYLESLSEKKNERFVEEVQLLITDIEMPQMDGHTLTRKIKEHRVLNRLPVAIFSSLITSDLLHKGEAVGADEQFSKPEVENLVQWIDSLYV
ncbi:MAG: chemotaxis protein [Sarcina sp.]